MITSKNSHFEIESTCVAEFDSEGDLEILAGTMDEVLEDLRRAKNRDQMKYGTVADWAEVVKVLWLHEPPQVPAEEEETHCPLCGKWGKLESDRCAECTKEDRRIR